MVVERRRDDVDDSERNNVVWAVSRKKSEVRVLSLFISHSLTIKLKYSGRTACSEVLE